MKIQCPECAKKGGDTSENGLHVYPKGDGWCFKCKTRFTAEEVEAGGKIERGGPVSKLTIEQIKTFPYGTDPDRKIDTDIAEHYGVRCSVNGETGKIDKVYYPYYDGGKISGYKVRELPKDFRPSAGTIGKSMFGETAEKYSDMLILTEGEEDCMAAKAMTAKTPSPPTVWSLPNGASLCKTVRGAADKFAKFKRIYLCTDDDPAGLNARLALADWLATITEVRIVELAVGCDPSDYHRAGKASKFRDAIRDAKVYEPEGVINGTDIDLDFLLEPTPEGYPVPFEGLQHKLKGLRKGEITTVCAGSGIGKSTLVREITYSLIKQGLSVANVALEDQMQVAAQSLVALDMNIPAAQFRFHPPPKAIVQPHYDDIVANGRTFFYKHFAGITADSLMNKLYYYARSKAVDFIVLDHLSLVISATDTQNERKAIDTLMTDLAKMVVETGVGLIQIVHLKRTGGEKSYARGGEVELTDLRGSAALEQLSWTVVGLERDQQGDDANFSVARVLKNRTWGFTGKADTLKYDPTTGRMSSVVPEEPDIDLEEAEEIASA